MNNHVPLQSLGVFKFLRSILGETILGELYQIVLSRWRPSFWLDNKQPMITILCETDRDNFKNKLIKKLIKRSENRSVACMMVKNI